MKPINWKFITAFGLIVLTLILAINIVGAQSGPVFRVGVLDEPDGPITRGAELAVQAINQAGGVRGADGTFFRLELMTQSTGAGANLAAAVTNLSQASVIAVLGPESTNEVINGLPILNNLTVPILTPATGDTVLTSDNLNRLFRIRAPEVYQGRALADYLVNGLNIQRIATVQLELDLETTAGIIGFSTAASALGIQAQPSLQVQKEGDIPQVVNQLIQANPQIIVVYGSAARASELYAALQANAFPGAFAYNHAEDGLFRSVVPNDQLQGIISTTTWPFGAVDSASTLFRDNFVRTYGDVPGPVEASAYDGISLLAAAINLPGELRSNLAQLDNIQGVQGILHPAQFARGETSNNVAVTQLNAFGVPEVLARYEGGQRLQLDENPGTPGVFPTAGPASTATPDGVTITVKQSRQNVRSGPGINYDILGQLNEGDQAKVVGATIDLTWVVIEFRGLQGWLATYLLDVFGDLKTVPIIAPPPTPTPAPSPTAVPFSDIVIDAAVALPSPIIVNQAFIVTVTVRNAGNTSAGQFAIAATFPPNNIFSSAIVPGLAPGQTTVVNLTGTFANTGAYSTVIVADLNNEVAEGPGENNNLFNFNYFVNKAVLRQGSQTLNAGESFDFEGTLAQYDLMWNAAATEFDVVGSAKVGAIGYQSLESVHYDLINPGTITGSNILRTSMNAGLIIGVITADGHRAALRVDDIPGNQIKFTFVVYQ